MQRRKDGGARPLAGGPGRNRQDNKGTKIVSQMVDELNHSAMRPALCCGCGRVAPAPGLAGSSVVGPDWQIATVWIDFETARGFFLAPLCATCHVKVGEPEFRRRLDRTILAIARDQIERMTGVAL